MNHVNGKHVTALNMACENKHDPVIKYLLERGADPLITDAEGNITLHWAALSGSMTTCERLLNRQTGSNRVYNILRSSRRKFDPQNRMFYVAL